MKCRRQNFTLLEILIFFLIISLVGSFLGVKGYSLFKKTHFEANIEKFLGFLRESRESAYLHGEDIIFIIQKGSHGFSTFKGFTGSKLQQDIFPHLTFYFNDKNIENLTFHFYSSVLIEPM